MDAVPIKANWLDQFETEAFQKGGWAARAGQRARHLRLLPLLPAGLGDAGRQHGRAGQPVPRPGAGARRGLSLVFALLQFGRAKVFRAMLVSCWARRASLLATQFGKRWSGLKSVVGLVCQLLPRFLLSRLILPQSSRLITSFSFCHCRPWHRHQPSL